MIRTGKGLKMDGLYIYIYIYMGWDIERRWRGRGGCGMWMWFKECKNPMEGAKEIEECCFDAPAQL
jgi:hypothetical protein